jgi:hypothetical protein
MLHQLHEVVLLVKHILVNGSDQQQHVAPQDMVLISGLLSIHDLDVKILGLSFLDALVHS